MTEDFKHITVLREESVEALQVKADGIYVDCTLGGGGHSRLILDHLSDQGRLYAFDQDLTAIQHAKERFAEEIAQGKLQLIHRNFRYLKEELARLDVDGVDGVLYDLGVSSPQLDQVERGFSYHQNAPLDMRMDQSAPLTAEDVVNDWSYDQLVKIFYRYGEEKFAKQIARQIERRRQDHRIKETGELVELIKEAIPAPARRKGGHPAKRVFQAIRIAVNDELGAVEDSLEAALDLLKVGGRISCISFQSLEDRIAKQLFKDASTVDQPPANIPILAQDLEEASYRLVTRKPIYPSKEELAHNPRAQSAKLRVIERIND
ncbi:16S rRNA (cytosine(1402)-N(4))-methyltransferase RsmH [Aerococcus sanguinicola]|uniref:16S rRNA (cytosine(1402)-N(4))-methyltransferase RsmH n=1 Tax=unclassified Aerococcus TaxID=2618060 RepID=UPI0008A347C2|nr:MULTISPECIES: 16S rRNA (cytosine(1402)-N(4))-methyltransferase RsmH [unclassified Aerococcus]KAB0647744.1 16S rRNA (cytosine(1402)-N(4))-methyltransferase RsmH [Aerococcus sanguinicola]MDK6233014.1 16S rRNA (cytosine(1402)-N(4))-methyltransferase RsmH [Aerococcus sp. UMB10185]MDK6855308.1 16S rRNA (cytosine(1402)-N(4))-methyltransferase RsmH [Aerococcus sp. UMB7533]MDK8502164.1 16S rRNA (cytosine(1402)-N(4))-methyltransferase RsmH [Aerococcus sp. UMB1112A]OFN04868.1 16S rRNA (cytosine(1402)